MGKDKGQILFSEAEVLAKLGVTRPTLEKWRLKGFIKYLKIGTKRMYKKEHIEDFIKRFEVE